MSAAGGGAHPCPSCGREHAPGTRFCTGCGAVLEPVAAAAPPPAPPPKPAPAPKPARAPKPRWALGTPPANERWWNNPVVVVVTAITLLGGGGGVAAWKFFINSSETAKVVRALPSSSFARHSDAPAQITPPSEEGIDVATPVRQIQHILRRSESGRIAAANRHDYAAALRNREHVLAELDAMGAPAGPEGLRQAYATLRAAIRASAHADGRHIACGCDTLLSADIAASRLKRRFAILFDPYAQRYLGERIDPERI